MVSYLELRELFLLGLSFTGSLAGFDVLLMGTFFFCGFCNWWGFLPLWRNLYIEMELCNSLFDM